MKVVAGRQCGERSGHVTLASPRETVTSHEWGNRAKWVTELEAALWFQRSLLYSYEDGILIYRSKGTTGVLRTRASCKAK